MPRFTYEVLEHKMVNYGPNMTNEESAVHGLLWSFFKHELDPINRFIWIDIDNKYFTFKALFSGKWVPLKTNKGIIKVRARGIEGPKTCKDYQIEMKMIGNE